MAEPNENLLRKLEEIDGQFQVLQAELLDPEVLADHNKVRTLSIRRAAMEPIVNGFRGWTRTCNEISDLQQMLESESDEDEDGTHVAVISYPVPDKEEASQYITLFTCPPGVMVAVLLSTVTPLTLRVTFPSAVDPP